MGIAQILVLIGLVRLLVETENPLLCASLYTGLSVIFGFLFGDGVTGALLNGALGFVFSFAYFWLLDRLAGTGLLWWAVLVGGLVGPFMLAMLLSVIGV